MQETPTKSSLLLATEEEEEQEAAFVPRYRNLKNVFEIAELLEKKVNLRAGTSGLQIPNWRGLYSPSCCEIRQPLIIMVKKEFQFTDEEDYCYGPMECRNRTGPTGSHFRG